MVLDLPMQNGMENQQMQMLKITEENNAMREVFDEIRALLLPMNFEARLQRKLDAHNWIVGAGKPPSSPKKQIPSKIRPPRQIRTFGDRNGSFSAQCSEDDDVGNGTKNGTANGTVNDTANVTVTEQEESLKQMQDSEKKFKSDAGKKEKQCVGNNLCLTEQIFHDRVELMRSGQGGDPMSQQNGQLYDRLSMLASALRNHPTLDDQMKVQRPPELVRKEESEEEWFSDEAENREQEQKDMLQVKKEATKQQQIDAAKSPDGRRTNGSCTKWPSKTNSPPATPSTPGQHRQLHSCGDCGQQKVEGKIDPNSKEWVCIDCCMTSDATATSLLSECQDCGMMKKKGKIEPDTGDWFCEDCWAQLEEAAGEGEEDKGNGVPLLCGDCGEMKILGATDPDSQDWFCSECWAAVEADA